MNLKKFSQMNQFNYFFKDIRALLGKNKYRILLIFFNRSFYSLLSYRIDRSLFLLFKSKYRFYRILLAPFFFLLQIISNCDIHYRADIKGGINIHHPSLGIVNSGKSIIGDGLTLTGGNTIGIKSGNPDGVIRLGENCNLGANSCIIGPLTLGNSMKIGAMACVTKSFVENNLILIGVPAQPFSK